MFALTWPTLFLSYLLFILNYYCKENILVKYYQLTYWFTQRRRFFFLIDFSLFVKYNIKTKNNILTYRPYLLWNLYGQIQVTQNTSCFQLNQLSGHLLCMLHCLKSTYHNVAPITHLFQNLMIREYFWCQLLIEAKQMMRRTS